MWYDVHETRVLFRWETTRILLHQFESTQRLRPMISLYTIYSKTTTIESIHEDYKYHEMFGLHTWYTYKHASRGQMKKQNNTRMGFLSPWNFIVFFNLHIISIHYLTTRSSPYWSHCRQCDYTLRFPSLFSEPLAGIAFVLPLHVFCSSFVT